MRNSLKGTVYPKIVHGIHTTTPKEDERLVLVTGWNVNINAVFPG